jgi:protein-L-isoaspartate(D-aspartate) O-methyltransferase
VTDFARSRGRMVERQLRARGIADERVLAAMGAVPRERFVSERLAWRAYADSALPLEAEQTISQPWVVAAICAGLELRGTERVLEIGTGSGYSAAVLARLAASVLSIERIESLAIRARQNLTDIEGSDRIEIRVGDGTLGAPDAAPFDAIAVHAAAPAPPPSLIAQLAVGGRLVIPVTEGRADVLKTYTNTEAGLVERVIAPCRFVPLVGAEGFSDRA